MCLYVASNKPLIAEYDITVYKLVKCGKRRDVFYPMLFNRYKDKYHIGRTEKPKPNRFKLFRKFEIKPSDNKHIGLYSIHGGCIHSASSIWKAFDSFLFTNYTKYAVIKCAIPKGAKYFTNEKKTLFASDRLRFDAVVIDLGNYHLQGINETNKKYIDYIFVNDSLTMQKRVRVTPDDTIVITGTNKDVY